MSLPATDSFTRADENPLAGNWTTVTGETAMRLMSSQVKGTAGGINGAYWNADVPGNDQGSSIKGVNGGFAGVYGPKVRVATGAQTYYLFTQDTASVCRVWKVVSGTQTQIGSDYSHSYAQYDVLTLNVVGADASAVLTPNINGVNQVTQTGVAGLNSGFFGIHAVGLNMLLDDWQGLNVGMVAAMPFDDVSAALVDLMAGHQHLNAIFGDNLEN